MHTPRERGSTSKALRLPGSTYTPKRGEKRDIKKKRKKKGNEITRKERDIIR